MHFEGEPDTYRDPEEVREWEQKDPINLYRNKLLSEKVDENILLEIEKQVTDELEEAVEFARNSPLLGPESALENVYA